MGYLKAWVVCQEKWVKGSSGQARSLVHFTDLPSTTSSSTRQKGKARSHNGCGSLHTCPQWYIATSNPFTRFVFGKPSGLHCTFCGPNPILLQVNGSATVMSCSPLSVRLPEQLACNFSISRLQPSSRPYVQPFVPTAMCTFRFVGKWNTRHVDVSLRTNSSSCHRAVAFPWLKPTTLNTTSPTYKPKLRYRGITTGGGMKI